MYNDSNPTKKILSFKALRIKPNDISNRFLLIINNLVQTIILKMWNEWSDEVLMCAFLGICLLICLLAHWLTDFKYLPLMFPGGYQGVP